MKFIEGKYKIIKNIKLGGILLVLQEVLDRFALIANLSADEVTPWIEICEDSISEIESNLRENIDQELNSRRLEAAAAGLSFYKSSLYRSSWAGMESFSAGELRIKTNSSENVKRAYKVWQEAKNSIYDLLKDNNFVFERIVSSWLLTLKK